MGNIAVFLDRDGTVNEEVDYLTSPQDLHLIPRSAEAVRLANELGLRVIIVTNQSGVARGLLTEAELLAVHRALADRLAAGGAAVDAIYYCPHHPSEGTGTYRRECDCRKPGTGMIDRAVREFRIDPARSYVIGDRTVDVGMAKNAGARAILVLTGYGREERVLCERDGIPLDYVADDLFDAMEFVARDIHNHTETTQA
jgi:D-glycero-D-manno-heptose 1,7-bisphosphate phosphatase